MCNQYNILDLVFTNEEGMVDDIIHESPLGNSDHSVLVFDYVCYAQIADHKQLRFFYNNGNYSSTRDVMSNCNWYNVLGTGDINEQWACLKDYIKKCENEFVPHKMVGNSSMHKGKIPSDRAAVRKKTHLVETFYGNKR